MKKLETREDAICKKVVHILMKNNDWRAKKEAEKIFPSEEKRDFYLWNLLFNSYTKDCTLFQYLDDMSVFIKEGISLDDIAMLWYKENRDKFLDVLWKMRENTPSAIVIGAFKKMKEI